VLAVASALEYVAAQWLSEPPRAVSRSIAHSWGFEEPVSCELRREACEMAGVPPELLAVLPRVLQDGEVLGRMCSSWANRLGLCASPTVLVPSGDNQMQTFGLVRNLGLEEGAPVAFLNLGTSCQLTRLFRPQDAAKLKVGLSTEGGRMVRRGDSQKKRGGGGRTTRCARRRTGARCHDGSATHAWGCGLGHGVQPQRRQFAGCHGRISRAVAAFAACGAPLPAGGVTRAVLS
jgi:hypothetical protein